jgi:UDP-2,4-diacetamido-2,4,6-trideoxy-beta-L-altropyranose hydrolase
LKIIFRADASLQIGTGHVIRCLTLAKALRDRGAVCTFVCREHEGNLIEKILQERFECIPLIQSSQITYMQDADGPHLAHDGWLGESWQNDAEQTIRVLDGEKVDWLVVDHYALDIRWEEMFRPYVKKIMVIDDLADRQHDCDLFLDQTYGSSSARYSGLVPINSKQYYGPAFAMLNLVYAEKRAHLPMRNGQVRRALIYFGGGADLENLTGMALKAFMAPKLASIQLDIVVGTAYAHQQSLKEALILRDNATMHQQLPNLAELMAKVDLAIGAGGATTWERCCLGLPSVLVVSALNQIKIGEAISNCGAGIVLYQSNNLTADIKKQVCNLCDDTEQYLQMSNIAKKICDGLGVLRIAENFF